MVLFLLSTNASPAPLALCESILVLPCAHLNPAPCFACLHHYTTTTGAVNTLHVFYIHTRTCIIRARGSWVTSAATPPPGGWESSAYLPGGQGRARSLCLLSCMAALIDSLAWWKITCALSCTLQPEEISPHTDDLSHFGCQRRRDEGVKKVHCCFVC